MENNGSNTTQDIILSSILQDLNIYKVVNTTIQYLDISGCPHPSTVCGYNNRVQDMTYGDETIYPEDLEVGRALWGDFHLSHLPYLTNAGFGGTNLKSINIDGCYNLAVA